MEIEECFFKTTDEFLSAFANTTHLSCCIEHIYFIVYCSNLSFPRLRVLTQLHKCRCVKTLEAHGVHKPHRLPLLQRIYFENGIPLIRHHDWLPAQELTLCYLLEQNKERLQIMTTLFLCLRQLTILDKGVIRLICLHVVMEEDLPRLHICALKESLKQRNIQLDVFQNTLNYLENDGRDFRTVEMMKYEMTVVRTKMHYIEIGISREEARLTCNKKQKTTK